MNFRAEAQLVAERVWPIEDHAHSAVIIEAALREAYHEGLERAAEVAWERPLDFGVPCTLCGATGDVGPEIIAQRETGQRLRGERVARMVGMTAEAAHLGISPSQLSKMERGMIPHIKEPK